MEPSPRPHTTHSASASGGWTAVARAVGVYFAGGAVLNAVYTVRIAHSFMAWMRDNAWLATYRVVLARLEKAAPAVVLSTAGFEAVVGYHLLRGRRVSGALRWAEAWVLGLCPALPWPYWVPNVVSGAVFGVIRRRLASIAAP